MRLINLIIFVLALSESECRYQILKKGSERDEHFARLAESAVSTLLSCYEQKVDTIGAVGITEPILHELLMTKQPLPVKLFTEKTLKITPLRPGVDTKFRHKLHLFVVEVPSDLKQFQPMLGRVLRSQHSGQLATYLIIDWPSEKGQKSCRSNAAHVLRMTWTMSILNAFYMCVDKLHDKVLVYSYNPYTSKAPAPWGLNGTYKGQNNHPWYLFVREYQPGNQQIWNNFDFVKDHDLGGSVIRFFIYTDLPFSEWTIQFAAERFQVDDGPTQYLRYSLWALNATAELYLFGRVDGQAVAWNPERKIFVQFPENLDIAVTISTSASTLTRTQATYPIVIANLAVLTHHAGSKSQLDKLLGVFDKRTRFGLFIVILITLLFFTCCMRQPLGTAFMNVMRIICNTGLLIVPNRNAPRLYLAGIFILVVTIFGTYQGLLAALLTKPTPLPEIETLEDLANSDHTIFVQGNFVEFFQDPRFNGRIAPQEQLFCGDPYLNSSTIACVNYRNAIIFDAINLKRHASREDVVPQYIVYVTKRNWVLEKRFNEIMFASAASGINSVFFDKDVQHKIEKARKIEELERDQPVVMKLADLGFAFAFLGIGLSLATFVLVIEIAMNRAGFR